MQSQFVEPIDLIINHFSPGHALSPSSIQASIRSKCSPQLHSELFQPRPSTTASGRAPQPGTHVDRAYGKSQDTTLRGETEGFRSFVVL